ncbi:MAG TPA: hypothetical protein PLI18_19730 [Pirellulaceae bacterium]|nr:hypothetical protein [Pirellulaceae bacterium]
MATFVDNRGRRWVIRITIPAAKHIRDAMSIDLLKFASDGEGVEIRKLTDVFAFQEVLFHTSQLSDGGSCTFEEFSELIGLEQLEAAMEPWFEALVDFFPPSRRELLKRIVAEGKRVADAETKKLNELIASGVIDAELKSAGDKEIARIESIFGSTSTDSPASPDSATSPA